MCRWQSAWIFIRSCAVAHAFFNLKPCLRIFQGSVSSSGDCSMLRENAEGIVLRIRSCSDFGGLTLITQLIYIETKSKRHRVMSNSLKSC